MIFVFALLLLLVKFIADLLVRIPFAASLLPISTPLARAGILYPLALALIIWHVWRDWRISLAVLAGGAILILAAGGTLI